MSILGSIVTMSSFNLFTWPATSIWPCFSFLVLIIRNTAETNLYLAFWFASTFVVTKWMASQVPSSIPLLSVWAKKKIKKLRTYFFLRASMIQTHYYRCQRKTQMSNNCCRSKVLRIFQKHHLLYVPFREVRWRDTLVLLHPRSLRLVGSIGWSREICKNLRLCYIRILGILFLLVRRWRCLDKGLVIKCLLLLTQWLIRL